MPPFLGWKPTAEPEAACALVAGTDFEQITVSGTFTTGSTLNITSLGGDRPHPARPTRTVDWGSHRGLNTPCL